MKYTAKINQATTQLWHNLQESKRRLATPRAMIDFETRCDIDIKKSGAFVYSNHESCEVLMMSYCLTNEPQDTKLWTFDQPPPQELLDFVARGNQLNAFNSYFEFCIWQNVCVPKLNWVELTGMQQILDVGDKCKALALPSNLEDAAQSMDIANLKDTRGKALIRKFCQPKRNGEYNNPLSLSNSVDWETFKTYCIRDTKAQLELDNILPDLSPKEQLVAWFTDELNWRGLHVDTYAAQAALELSDKIKVKYNAEASKLSGRLFEKCTQRAKVKQWLRGKGVVMPDMQAPTIAKWLRKDNLPSTVRRMLELYQITGSTSVAKYKAMLLMTDPKTRRVHELLNYHKARTGRWGGKGIQIQNFPRPTLPKSTNYGDVLTLIKRGKVSAIEKFAKQAKVTPMVVLVSALRSCITPVWENEFKSADYSAIEARVLLWVAQDQRALDIFRRGEDLYLDMASGIYNIPVEKLSKDSPERFMGKTAILGCGYGVGGAAFAKQVEDMSGVKLSLVEAKSTVTKYRQRFPKVVQLWRDMEKLAVHCVRTGRATNHDTGVTFYMDRFGSKSFLMCKLPSGHTLGYPNPKLRTADTSWSDKKSELTYEGLDSYTHKWTNLKTYGGKLVENIVQAIARDLLVYGMLLLDAVGYNIIMSVHDEVVSEDDEEFGSLEELEALLCHLPKWAVDMPVASEGWVGDRYRK